MAKQMVEVDVPDGWEVVGFRKAELGEHILLESLDTGNADVFEQSFESNSRWIVVRRKHVWPSWLPPGWVAVDGDGAAWWYERKPEQCKTMWNGSEPARLDAFIRHGSLTLPPLDDDWTKNIWEVRHDPS